MESYSSLLEAFDALNVRKRRDPAALDRGERRRWKEMRREIELALFNNAPDPAVDTREYLRVPVCLSVRYWTSNELKDRYIPVLGEGGLFVSTVDPLPVGARLDMEIVLARRGLLIPVQGEVVWTNDCEDPARRGMGIRFVELSYEQKRAIYELVDDTLRERLLERRQHARVDAKLQVEFLYADGYFELTTEDISQGGLFIATDHFLPVGERIRIVLHLPGSAPAIKAVAEVRRVVEKAEPGQPIGLGVAFVDLDDGTRELIREYVVSRVLAQEPAPGARERRRHPRMERRIKIRFQSDHAFGVSCSRDISTGGVFIQTHEPPPLGSRIEVTLIHPIHLHPLSLSGDVVRVVEADPAVPSQVPGVGVAFGELEPGQQSALQDFLQYYARLDGADAEAEEGG